MRRGEDPALSALEPGVAVLGAQVLCQLPRPRRPEVAVRARALLQLPADEWRMGLLCRVN